MTRTVFHLAGDDRSGVTRTLLAFASAHVSFQQRFVLWPDESTQPRASHWLADAGAEVLWPRTGRFGKVRTYRSHMRGPDACALAHVDGDVVWLHLGRTLGLLRRGLPMVAMRHNTGALLLDRPAGWLGRWARLLVDGYRQADAVVAVGPDVQRDLSALGIQSVEIRNPVDIAGLGKIPPVRSIRRLLFMGRLNEPGAVVHKDLATAIRGLATARDQQLQLTVAGDGPMRAAHEELTRSLRLAHRIAFLGWTDPAQALAASDAVVLSSIGPEGYPLVGAEAAAAGRLLVFSEGKGMGQFAEVGLGFPAGDAAALAAVLDRAACMGGVEIAAIGARARDWAAEHHDPAKWADRWSRLVAGL